VVSEATYSSIMKTLLFSAEGEELYLRNPASFNIPYGTQVEQIPDFQPEALQCCACSCRGATVLLQLSGKQSTLSMKCFGNL